MRTVYRVTVAATKYDDEGNFVADETLFEATHHRPEALLRFAPTEVDDALRVVAGVEVATVPPPAAPIPAATWDAVATDPEPQAVDAAVPQQNATDPDAPAKRKRRTKAEIEADKARAAASGDSFGEKVVADTEAAADAPLIVTATVPAEAVVEAPPAEPAPVATAPAAAPAPSGDGQPWNPFLQR